MNVEQFIQSGILEAYALGACNAAEQAEVERMAAAHPEVKTALDAIFADLEKMAFAGAVPPPPALKGRIMEAIAQAQAARPNPPVPSAASKGALWMWLMALFILAQGILVIYLNAQLLKAKRQMAETEQRMADCESRQQQLQAAQSQQLALLADPATRLVRISPLSGRSETWQLTLYHNPANAKTLLHLASLPPAPAGKDWQLWAIVNGAPQSMGVIALQGQTQPLLNMPFVEQAEAFAISLEPAGGSASPTEVVALGKAG